MQPVFNVLTGILLLLAPSSPKHSTLKDSISTLLESSYYLSMNNPDSSKAVVERAIEISKDINNDTLLADCYIEMTYIQGDLGNTLAATQYAFEALELYEKHNKQSGMARAFMRISWQNLVAGKHNDVFEYLYNALDIASNLNNEKLLSSVYHMLGAAYNWTNKYFIESKQEVLNDSFYMWADSAILYDLKAVEIRRKHNISGLHSSLNNLGMAYYRKALATNEGFEKAQAAHNEAREIREKNNNFRGLIGSNLQLATVTERKGDIDSALHFLRYSRHLAEKHDYSLHKKVVYDRLYTFFEKLGQHDSALFYYKKLTNIEKQTANNDYKTSIKELETKYDIAGKEKEIALAKQKMKNQQAMLMLGLIFLILMVIAVVVFYRLYKKNESLSERNAVLIREQNHRVKNNLQLISALLSLQAKQTPDKSARKVIEDSQGRVEAIGLIQKRLYGDNLVDINLQEFIPELVDAITSFFEFQQPAINKILTIEPIWLKVEKSVSLGLILNELITNSCKYAFARVTKPELKITVSKYNNTIAFRYADNGPGFIPEQNTQTDSFGLKIINIQTQQLQGKPRWERNGEMVFKTEFAC